MRLSNDGSYTTDISALRAQIRANGTIPRISIVNISHPQADSTVAFHINLAYQSNSQFPGINGSLYTVAFGNSHGTWHFNVGNIGIPALPGVLIPGGLAGSYASLGFGVNPLPNITNQNLVDAINVVSNYGGAQLAGDNVLAGLARLIIAVNEAARFDMVENAINTVLGNTDAYTPPGDTIRNWGGHILGS